MIGDKIKFSILIPYKKTTKYLKECLEYINKQTYRNFEVILLPDKKGKSVGPAEKRDLGVRKSKGEILAFIDDDAYPDSNWLKNTLSYFKNPEVAAVCGPGITPSTDSILQKASGWVNSLWLGSGGAGTYRFTPQKKRFVDDYPSMNFLVRKSDYLKIGGFDTHFWPGEDTKLCFDLVYILKKKIIYDPKILVYHHRRSLFMPHLLQISRYAIHRGHFCRILPKTSFRIGYLVPTFFVLFLITGFPLKQLYLSVLSLYLVLLTANMFYVTFKTGSILLSVLTGSGILLTHLIYGILFPYGFFKGSLKQ